jgi:hypothetical protein
MNQLARGVILSSITGIALAQNDNVILFGEYIEQDAEFDLSFQYNPATNLAINLNTDQYPAACLFTDTETATNSTALIGNDLSISGVINWAGCQDEVLFRGNVLIFPNELEEGFVAAADPVTVDEPPAWWLWLTGLLAVIAFSKLGILIAETSWLRRRAERGKRKEAQCQDQTENQDSGSARFGEDVLSEMPPASPDSVPHG